MNSKGWTFKRKNQVLAVGALLFFLFIYNYVISITINLYRVNKDLNQKIVEGVNAPQRKKELEHKLVRFNNSLNKYFSDSLKNREYILGVVSDYCHKNNIVLREFPEPTLSQEKDFEIETNVIVAEGSYINLLQLVYELEQKTKIARPASVAFEKKMDSKRKKEVLTATIYLQNLRLKENEK